MPACSAQTPLQTKVRRLTALCLALWLLITLSPVLAAMAPARIWWGWPVDFWLAAQGTVVAYVVLVAVYAGLVNRWERQAGASALDIPAPATD